MLTLEQWSKATFGDNGPKCILTLRRWAAAGKIIPKPRKVGNRYLVTPGARYYNPNDIPSLADRF